MNTFYEHRSCSPLLIAEKFYWCDSWVPATVLLGGDEPWLRRLLGISVAPQVGSSFNEAVRDNTAKRWNGVAARRTTQSNATHHGRYQVTRKSLDAARCTGEALLVIAKNRVLLCILHCCMACERLFVAFLEAQVGNHAREVAGEVQKIPYRNRCGVRFGAHNAPDGEEAHNLFWASEGDARGGGGEGVLVVIPWLRGEAGHAWGLSHTNQRNMLTLPWVQGALDSGYSPDTPLFSSPEATYITLRWAFCRLLRHRIRKKGAGGGGGGGLAAHRGGMGMETPAEKAPVPHPRPNWGREFDAGHSFYGPARGLDVGVPLGIVPPPLGGKGVGEAAAL